MESPGSRNTRGTHQQPPISVCIYCTGQNTLAGASYLEKLRSVFAGRPGRKVKLTLILKAFEEKMHLNGHLDFECEEWLLFLEIILHSVDPGHCGVELITERGEA